MFLRCLSKTRLGGQEEKTLIALLAGKRKVFLRISFIQHASVV